MSGGEALVKALVGEGVEVVFGIPGIHMYGIIAAMRDEPNIRMISTRHEQATTYMADGYSRVSGKPGVALVVPGVGMYNAASGLATAYPRSSPVLMIAGQIPRGQIGKNVGAVHEVLDQADIVHPVTKWRRQVMRPREIPDAVREAFRQMRTGRPRPVLMCMAGDGGFMFNASELSTAVKYDIPVVTVVFRNDSYGNVARDLNELFTGAYGTDLHNPDFVKFAESFGAGGHRRPLRRHVDTTRPADCASLCAALDHAPERPDRFLGGGIGRQHDPGTGGFETRPYIGCRVPVAQAPKRRPLERTD